jgi:hypothetical protein
MSSMDPDTWMKLGAAVFLIALVLIIFWGFMMASVSTTCWRGVVKPFDEAFSVSSQIVTGAKDSFKVSLNLDSNCLLKIDFPNDQSSCANGCDKTGDYDCNKQCVAKCAKGCILLLPSSKYKAPFQSNLIITRNKAMVYGGGDYTFTFSENIKTSLKRTILPGYSEKCLVFTKDSSAKDGKSYYVEAKSTEAECK